MSFKIHEKKKMDNKPFVSPRESPEGRMLHVLNAEC